MDFAEDNLDPDLPTHFNTANEWILRNVTVGGSPVAPLYDDNGNMTDDDENYTYKYDPWNRLVSISTTGGSPALVAEYRYNGLGQRISESDGTDTEYLIYDDSWQLIARFDGASTKYTEEILYHHAGLDGLGGSSAMDSVILRRTFLSSGSPQTEDKRWYILQNWRNDPVVTLTDAGVQVERVRFSPYGEAFGIPSGDLDFNGEATLAEEILLSSWASIPLAYRAYADINLDGVIDAADGAAASGATMGRGVLSHVSSKIGYAGYTQDAYVPTVSHVRHRVYKSDLGRWLQRDPAGYVDGPSLYEYAMGAPVVYRDPLGMQALSAPLPISPPPSAPPLRYVPVPPAAPGGIPPAALAVCGKVCVVVGVGVVCYKIGNEIEEHFLPQPKPQHITQPGWQRPKDDREHPKDCSDAEHAALKAAQDAACAGSDGKPTDWSPCKRMRNKSTQACEMVNELLNCIDARERVQEFHRRCDSKRGVPPSESQRRWENHRIRIRNLSKAMLECSKKCHGADRKLVW